jgi:hypothetical protein
MEGPKPENQWPILRQSDEALLKDLFAILSTRSLGNPYSSDGSFAARVAKLPTGLRAMAATHWLDFSLAIDSLTFHFGNFGEPQLVELTEAGLFELELNEFAELFREAKKLVVPILKRRRPNDDVYEALDRRGLTVERDRIDDRATLLGKAAPGKSRIYDAWVRYARLHPERVFLG